MNCMRIDIKTKGKVKDPDIRAIYILDEAVKTSTPRMLQANLKFVLSKYGLTVTNKQN